LDSQQFNVLLRGHQQQLTFFKQHSRWRRRRYWSSLTRNMHRLNRCILGDFRWLISSKLKLPGWAERYGRRRCLRGLGLKYCLLTLGLFRLVPQLQSGRLRSWQFHRNTLQPKSGVNCRHSSDVFASVQSLNHQGQCFSRVKDRNV
jgi:hypothetical protein